LFSAASDEGRPILTGIKIKEDGEETLLAATDGYRLSTKKIVLPLKKFVDAVIPARTLSEVLKIANEEKEEKTVYVGKTPDGQVGFMVGDTTIFTRLLDGEYPNFDRIIPKTFTTRVLIDKEPFARAVRSAAIFAKDNANIVRVVLDKQKIVVSANAPQVGENKVELDAKIDGDGGEIAFNSRFLVEFLANLAESEFVFEMTGALNPGVFKLVKDESFLHIIMPVRVTS
jgi:DNA polymerase-3 subunit beta